MPVYEYLCSACRRRLEVWQKMSDAPLTDCPLCGSATLGKMVSAPAVIGARDGWKEAEPGCGRGACPACAN